MQLRYALYERTPSGYCWTWRAAGLSDVMLDDFLYRIAIPNDSNSIASDNLRGGICKFGRRVGAGVEQHVVLYRFFDGGNDAGRPNRVVMLTAWTTPIQVTGFQERYELSSIFRNDVFEYVSGNARAGGIAPPPFCESLATDEEVRAGGTKRVPSAVLMEFLDEGIPDEGADCHLTLRDNDYAWHKKPSAVCERRQNEGLTDLRQNELEKEVRAGDNVGGLAVTVGKVHPRYKTKAIGAIKASSVVLAVLSLCVLLAAGAVQYGSHYWWGRGTLSKEAVEVVRMFRGLSLGEQRTVLGQLHEQVEKRQLREGYQGGTSYPATSPYTQQPTKSPPVQSNQPARGAGGY